MQCPNCYGYQTTCVDSRERDGIRWRRYLCDCGRKFTTYESYDRPKIEPKEQELEEYADWRCEECKLARAASEWFRRGKK